MPNEQLLTFLRAQLSQGTPRDELIRQALKLGWKVEEVNIAFNTLDNEAAMFARSALPPTPGQPGSSGAGIEPLVETRLPGVMALAKRGWSLLVERAGTLISIGLVAALPGILIEILNQMPEAISLISDAVDASLANAIIILALTLLAVVGALLLSYTSVIAVMHVLIAEAPITAGEAYLRAWRQLLANMWVALLFYLTLMGAVLLGLFVLIGIWTLIALWQGVDQTNSMLGVITTIVIPILFALVFFMSIWVVSIWLQFSQWLVVADRARGLTALLESKRLVHGYFWPILGRGLGLGVLLSGGLLLVAIPVVLILVALFMVGKVPIEFIEPISLLFSWAINIVLIPLVLAMAYPLYEARKALPISPEPTRGKRLFVGLIVVSILSFIAIPFAAVFLASSFNIAALLQSYPASAVGPPASTPRPVEFESSPYVDQEYEYTIKIPRGWEKYPEGVQFFSPLPDQEGDDLYRTNFFIDVIPDVPLATVGRAYEEFMANAPATVTQLSNRSLFVSGLPAILAVVKADAEGVSLRSSMLFVLSEDQTFYLVAATTLDSYWESHKDLFEALLTSLVVK